MGEEREREGYCHRGSNAEYDWCVCVFLCLEIYIYIYVCVCVCDRMGVFFFFFLFVSIFLSIILSFSFIHDSFLSYHYLDHDFNFRLTSRCSVNQNTVSTLLAEQSR